MEQRFHQAIVRLPCPEMVNGLTSSNLGRPGYVTALGQHWEYVEALRYCGLSVKILEADGRFPDSTFIEDVAVCTPLCAVITNPGASSRKGEIEGIRQVLRKFYDNIEEITAPGTLEGGDVMMVSGHYYIGISGRTNNKGADQLIDILSREGYSASKVPLNSLLHLKSGASYLESNTVLLSGELSTAEEFSGFRKIFAGAGEEYAANSLWLNGKVLVAAGFQETRNLIEKAGYETIELDVSEFRKLDGGLSCLSLRF